MVSQVQQGNAALSIKTKNLSLTLPSESGPVEILRGVDLEIKAGDTVGLVGPSGSGKTSLLTLLAGLERPTGGTVDVDGVNIADLNEDDLARFRRLRVGIIFQSFHLVATMTALENVALPLELAYQKNAESRAKAALDAVGLSHRLQHFPWQLSGGEQQRVAVARAFVVSPRIMFADEPTGNLDQQSGQIVSDLLFSMTQEHGATLLLITHDQKLAQRCRRHIAMSAGRLMEQSASH